MSLASLLPTPVQSFRTTENIIDIPEKSLVQIQYGPPPYLHRNNYIPRHSEDYGDGGAFPEIQMAQFPLEMGKTKVDISRSKVLPLQVDAAGKIQYDAIVKHGHHKDKIVKSKYEDLLPKPIEEEENFQLPKEDMIAETTEKTRQALEKLVSGKIAAAMPVRAADQRAPAKYIRYTASQQNTSFNSGAKQRIVRMMDMPKDPLSPPRFNVNKKIPRGAGSPPAPVLHSPTRKVTVKEQQDWKIPPCISNWKNAKGYTIPLDKRLAADGRGLQEVTINENFAKLAEALYIADRKAREAVEMRAQMERKLAQKEKEKKEEHLRLLAQRAREARAGIKQTITEHLGANKTAGGANREGDTDKSEFLEREQLRQDRHRDRQRERNLAKAAPDRKGKMEKERDISEKIALGVPNPGFNKQGDILDSQFDQRLFNQSKGMDSGFTADDAYNVYDKPWRDTATLGHSIYRPSKGVADSDAYGDDFDALVKTNRFVPDKPFSGLESGREDEPGTVNRRQGPVQFEKQRNTEDPFNLDKFLGSVKKAAGLSETPSSNSQNSGKKRLAGNQAPERGNKKR
ncbi:unnamed protein product [Gordionus sp. m RMFG-2023]|uniref:SNW domain-containing protein 1-like n=1 Tax=Gordionus sp. m RMFG-2023 TaxID=3053472 RepID=UPI0030E4AA9B